jgi:protein SCO1/2
MVRRALQVALGLTLGLVVALVLLFLRAESPAGSGPPEEPVARAILADPFPAPPLQLVDPEGTPVTLDDFRGSWVALFFGYTYCPDVCPLTLAVLGRLQEEESRRGRPFEVVFVTVDPERDTPDRLTRFAAGLPGQVRVLSAGGEDVRRQAFAFGVDVQRPGAPEVVDPDGPVPDYRVDHTARTFLVDPRGRVAATLPAMVSGPEARAILERLGVGTDS